MERLPEHIKKIAGGFVANLKECFSDGLISVILYGPAARGEELKGRTLLHFMAVVRDNTPSELAPCSAFIKRWVKDQIAVPLFITPEYIGNSRDTFPLEFMEMKSSYTVVYGEDVLGGIEFCKGDVRIECERDLKGKLLHLRAEYLVHRGNWKELAHLMHRSLESFRLVFAGVLFLKGQTSPEKTPYLLDMVAAEYGIDGTLFKRLFELSRGSGKPDSEETDRLFDLYVEELDKLSHALDALDEMEE